MKMKEVCKRTGLTERTVRFYVEENLLSPKSSLINGREYRDYSEQDVAELITIADLRKMFFSIDEIKEMKEAPTRIAEVVSMYKIKLAADAQAKASIVQTLDNIDIALLSDVNALAVRLKSMSANLPLPKRDIDPDFGRFDSESKEEREHQYNLYLAKQKRQYRLGQIIVSSISIINVISALISAFVNFSFFSLLIQVIVSIALFAGVTWIRYLFVVGAVLSIILNLMLLTSEYVSMMTQGLMIVTVFQMIYAALASFLLLKSNSVSEFLYSQKNG
ncbi:hypothetical protein Back11_14100 [Paenibacillus baekrokdamisoli]|uniref:Uncharacterized protein n=1 Tax=Paenibacillus baekrokdamisoli TaxID=1712516 RepID=A0A3G9IVD5_9BACL|nr:MerR family transcriptional regulator [Paenibacillus baekrokdamisoli]MBB3070716.1 DNA-binding transcriptional MerR regulator [Paenibacillus baekrokdamisoli]BBH20065.1 hypothetical protein Back11_14100 [Paenibacillus baekrokdamisoli]